MSAKGNAYDESVVQSLIGTLKCGTTYLQKVKSLSYLIKIIGEYIYLYNHDITKLPLSGWSPIQYLPMNQSVVRK